MQNIENKQRIGIIFGGQSVEHEVSIASATNVIAALDKSRFEAVPIGITKQGNWVPCTPKQLPTLQPATKEKANIRLLDDIDVVFPLVHGTGGEDGSLQGLLELLGIPYVGCGVLSSAICMDKDITKRLLGTAGMTVAGYMTIHSHESVESSDIVARLGLPLFVKPANSGSSVGVSKVTSEKDIPPALKKAFRFDNKILIEKAITGDEVECSVLGNKEPRVSLPGRVTAAADFYDYESKYTDGKATLEIPVHLTPKMRRAVQKTALDAFKTLGCQGMARVDMFVTPKNEIVVNEVNTIPGFTKFSMYPKLWEVSGLSYTQLITELLSLATVRSTNW